MTSVWALHVPPPHMLGGVSTPAEHVPAAPHVAPSATCSQPPALQLPSLPHGATGHCPAGAGDPVVTSAQTPSIMPVSAAVHALQVLSHATLQHTSLAQ